MNSFTADTYIITFPSVPYFPQNETELFDKINLNRSIVKRFKDSSVSKTDIVFEKKDLPFLLFYYGFSHRINTIVLIDDIIRNLSNVAGLKVVHDWYAGSFFAVKKKSFRKWISKNKNRFNKKRIPVTLTGLSPMSTYGYFGQKAKPYCDDVPKAEIRFSQNTQL